MTMTVNSSQNMLLLNRKRAAYEINRDIHVFYLLAVSIASDQAFQFDFHVFAKLPTISLYVY